MKSLNTPNTIIAEERIPIKHKLHIYPKRYEAKPSGHEVAVISTNIVNYVVEVTIEELAYAVADGKNWTSAYLKGSRNNDNWINQSIFALDFDCGVSFKELFERLKSQGLDCTFAYATFSSTPDKPKYRIVWQLDNVVTNIDEQKQIIKALTMILPEHDKQATAPSQMFYGGKELIYENYDYYLDLPLLLIEVASDVTSNSKLEKISRDLKRWNKGMGNIDWVKNGNAYSNIYRDFQKSPKLTTHTPLLKVDWERLKSEIKILDDLVSGKWLTYPQCFGLITNLLYLHGGVALYKKSLDKMVELNKDNPNFHEAFIRKPKFLGKLYNLPSVLKAYQNYHPMQLERFSPYEEDYIYSDLLQASRKYEVIRVKPYKTIPLQTAEKKFHELFKTVIESNDTNVYVLKVATGLGKTRQLETLDRALIALPNHDLKNQVEKRMRIPTKITPDLPDNLSSEVKEQIDYYFSVGAIEEANRFIARESEINPDLREYRRKLKEAYVSDTTVLTTHSKALFIDFNNLNTIIFDEDPLYSLLSIGSITVNDLVNLKSRISDEVDQAALGAYINSIVSGLKNCPLETRRIGFRNFAAIEDEVLSNSYRYHGNVLSFFDSDWYVSDTHKSSTVYFIRMNSLPENKKIIVLSATADEEIYKKLVGARLRFYDISNVEMKGVIEQDNTYSFSRNSLKNEKHWAYAKQQVGDLPTLTFAGYKHLFDSPVELMHYGKLSGFDDLTGQDIGIVGTPHQNPIVYLLFATALGIEFRPKDFRMAVQLVERNGIRYPLNTYAHEGLRNLHLFFLESEQIQAVGRARPLRNAVLIKLLSQCILPMAHITDEEKKLARQRLEPIRKTENFVKEILAA